MSRAAADRQHRPGAATAARLPGTHTDAYSDTNAHSDTNANAHPDRNTNSDTDTDAHSNVDGQPEPAINARRRVPTAGPVAHPRYPHEADSPGRRGSNSAASRRTGRGSTVRGASRRDERDGHERQRARLPDGLSR